MKCFVINFCSRCSQCKVKGTALRSVMVKRCGIFCVIVLQRFMGKKKIHHPVQLSRYIDCNYNVLYLTYKNWKCLEQVCAAIKIVIQKGFLFRTCKMNILWIIDNSGPMLICRHKMRCFVFVFVFVLSF